LTRTPLRILLVDDERERQERLISWLPLGFRAVAADTAGRAIGIIRRDAGEVYAAILLDYDLGGRGAHSSSAVLCGEDVAGAISEFVSRRTRVLIHSNDRIHTPGLVRMLESAGFEVWRRPIAELTERELAEWLAEVRAEWEG
jgi:CheY-like chemotaxis protein